MPDDVSDDLGKTRLPDPAHEVIAGRYQILQVLGQGNMGAVKKARDLELQRVVALKIPHPEILRRHDARARFLNEARTAARIEHPNFCPILDIRSDHDPLFLTMKFIEGESLESVLNASPSGLEPVEAARMVAEIATAMEVAHQAGIVHRDLKPANIMVQHADRRLIIMDFGLALQADATRLTVPGGLVGSPAYMSPEQADEELYGAIGPRSDIFTLGAIFYELLTGRRPFSGSLASVVNQILNKEPTRPTALRPNLDPRLESICLRAMAKQPADRYASMAAMADELRLSLAHVEVKATIDVVTSTIRDLLSPHASSAIALLAGALGNSTGSRDVETHQAAPRLPESTPHVGQTRNDNSLKMMFSWCPPGTFLMGSPEDEPERRANERQVEVTITRGFWMGTYPVMQGEWQALMGAMPLAFQGNAGSGDRYPIYEVSHLEAEEFCQTLTAREREAHRVPDGWEYRLPTEAQWEYACRAGTTEATEFGDRLDSTQANFNGSHPYNGASTGPSLEGTTPVGSYAPNAWGLFDMHGNVWEWCRDIYVDRISGGFNPFVSHTSNLNRCVMRGGSWGDDGHTCRSAFRAGGVPGCRNDILGFRVAFVMCEH